ncbi:putative non-specific serine/threonine protein kinase [Helianthus annuus]|nr:putative non-specific serine/threonine protein kinase [Helianthus annuus]
MTLVLMILLRIFFLLVTQGSLVNDSISYNSIALNSTLTPHKNPSWFSPSGLFAFGFYPHDDGFAVGIWLMTKPEITVVWTANPDGPPFSSNSTIVLSRNGWLSLLTLHDKNNILVPQDDSATSASMFDSGNFVLYKDSEVVFPRVTLFCIPTYSQLPLVT